MIRVPGSIASMAARNSTSSSGARNSQYCRTIALPYPRLTRCSMAASRLRQRGTVTRGISMRILYGVVGEGMGHATRSRVILDHLVARNHEVQIVVSGRAHDYLKKRFEGVKNIWGFQFVYADNEVKNFRTVLLNLKGALAGLPKNARQYLEIARSFRP